MQRDLFISHSSADADAARELRVELEAAGYSCWMAPDDVTGTEPWAQQILMAIRDSRAMLVLVSAQANASLHVAREVELANGRGRAILPVRIENVAPEGALEYHLAGLQRMDAFPPPVVDHRDRILRRLASIVPLPPAVPPTEPMPAPSPAPSAPATHDASTGADRSLPDAAAPAVPGVGSRIGGFTIESVLGEGGMATVYRAAQLEPRRAVALKLIRADRAADPTYRQRFLAEKDTLAGLEHPSIVPIYAAGDDRGHLFIAMRLIDGPDLGARIVRSGRMSLKETVATLQPIADAIDFAHEMGIVHRDLKPSNIILDRHGRPYLTDFGLGKSFEHSGGLSTPGVAVGTLDYMAPEQFSGSIDPDLAGRMDIYALACVAFTCLTGAPPFRADEPQQVMYGHLNAVPPSVRATRPDLPEAVDTALRRALAKKPADRYATADELLRTLAVAADVSDAHTAPIPIAPGRPRRFGAWARANSVLAASLVTLVAVISIGAGVVALNPAVSETSAPSGSQRAEATDPATVRPSPTRNDESPVVSDTPTEAPTGFPTIAPTPTPTNAPPRTQAPDRQPPTNIGITIKGDDIKTSKQVNLATPATGATQMRLGRAGSATGSCNWEAWRAYDSTVNDFDLKGGGGAGERWVCAEYRDAAGNESDDVRDSVLFDNAPRSTNYHWRLDTPESTRALYCSYSTITLQVVGYAAVDDDGNGTLELLDVWQGSTHWDIESRTSFSFTNPQPGSVSDYIFTFEVEDDFGVRRSGTFTVRIGPC